MYPGAGHTAPHFLPEGAKHKIAQTAFLPLPYLINIWYAGTDILYINDQEIHQKPILTAEKIVLQNHKTECQNVLLPSNN